MKKTPIIDALPFLQMVRGYTQLTFRQDLLAGLTVGMIAVPLSMALAIGSGVAPQYGLYTAIVAGFLIALFGGSRFNVSGPTAAFVVILQPITAQFGLSGLLTASFLAGLLLLAMGLAKLGKLVYWVPEPVISGFSSGIAVVIALSQLPDFFGVTLGATSTDLMGRMNGLAEGVVRVSLADLALGIMTLMGLILLPRLYRKMPPHLVVLAISAVIGVAFSSLGWELRTIGSVFQYQLAGEVHHGIPGVLPTLRWPWLDDSGLSMLSGSVLWALLPSVLAIAFLGAVESLLCAVVADGMTETKHDPNAELLGQGIGNIVAPFVGGFAATGALARTAANIRAGAKTPVAAMIHAVFVLLALLLFAQLLGYLPMASLAALLLLVAWHMGNLRQLVMIWGMAPAADRLVLATCLVLTVAFDMVVAVTTGIVLAGLLFVVQTATFRYGGGAANQAAAMTVATACRSRCAQPLLAPVVLTVGGPLFFGNARSTLTAFEQALAGAEGTDQVILEVTHMWLIDLSGLLMLCSLLDVLLRQKRRVVVVGLKGAAKRHFIRARLTPAWRSGLYWAEED